MSKLLFVVPVLLAGVLASAADLTLTCGVTSTQGASQSTFSKKFEINYDSRTVSEYRDMGLGMDFYQSISLNLADNDKIIFGYSSIDRHTGEYLERTPTSVTRGTCHRETTNKNTPPIF